MQQVLHQRARRRLPKHHSVPGTASIFPLGTPNSLPTCGKNVSAAQAASTQAPVAPNAKISNSSRPSGLALLKAAASCKHRVCQLGDGRRLASHPDKSPSQAAEHLTSSMHQTEWLCSTRWAVMYAASSSLRPSCLLASARYSMWSCRRSSGVAEHESEGSRVSRGRRWPLAGDMGCSHGRAHKPHLADVPVRQKEQVALVPQQPRCQYAEHTQRLCVWVHPGQAGQAQQVPNML